MRFGAVRRLLLAGLASLLLPNLASAQIVNTTPSTKIGTAALISPSSAAAYYAPFGTANTPDPHITATPKEVVELARALKNDPDLIFAYIRNNIDTVWMFGAQKGALGPIIDRSGTAFDQAMLMVQLVRQGGGTANYQFGTISPTPAQFQAWTGISDAKAACQLLASGGIPAIVNGSTTADCSYSGPLASITLSHVWVQVTIGGTPYLFDPAFKPHGFKAGVNLATAANFTAGQPMAQATSGATLSSTAGVNFAQSLNTTQLTNTLQASGAYLQTWIDDPSHGVAAGEVEDVVGGSHITAATPAELAHVTALAYPSSLSTSWPDVPDAYRTAMRVQVSRGTTSSGTLSLFNRLLFIDKIYGRKLMVYSRNGGSGGFGTDTLQLVDEFGAATVLDTGAGTADDPALNDATITLTVDHPYAATGPGGAGKYMDATIVKHAWMWMPLMIVHSWGDTDKRLVDKWGARDDMEANLQPQPPCETCGVFAASAGDARREQLAGAWMVQSSKAARLHAAIAKSTYAHHHSVGIVAADTQIGTATQTNPGNAPTLYYSIRDSFDRLDIDSGFSLTSNTANATDRRAAVFAIAETLDTLEGAVAAQIADLPDTVSTAMRFDWGNAPPSGVNDANGSNGVSRKVYYYVDSTAAQQASVNARFEGAQTANGASEHDRNTPTFTAGEASEWEGALAAAITDYANIGFRVVASEESFLGPGQRAGAFTSGSGGTLFGHYRTKQRGGALVAMKIDSAGDPTDIAHIAVGLRDRAKGGGGGAQAGHQAQYDPGKAADVLKARFVDHSSALGVDLASGSVTYTSPASLSVGQGEFPYKLDAQIIWRGGEATSGSFGPLNHTQPQTPWTSNWNNTLTISGSGLEAMGDTDVRTSAGTIAAFMALQDIYRATPSAEREVAAGIVGAWWARQLSGNVVTVNVGAGSRQFVKRVGGDWLAPGPGAYATLTQNGTPRSVYTDNCNKVGYVTTRGWNYSGLNFDVRLANGDTQHFGYWAKQIVNGDNYCNNFHGFHLTTWTFPQGVTVTVNYDTSGGDLERIKDVSNNLGRKINFIHGGMATPSTAGGFDNGLTGQYLRTVTIAAGGLSHTDPDQKTTTFEVSTTGGWMGSVGGKYRLEAVHAADNPSTPALAYTYDSLGRVMTAKDRLGVMGQRPAYEFRIAEGLRGERLDPMGKTFVVDYDLKKHPIRFVDEANNITTATYDGRGRTTSYTYPELDQETFEFDNRNNPTKLTKIPKPGSMQAGVLLSNAVTEASWETTWNKLAYVIDPKSHRTDFSYFASGPGASLLSEALRPAMSAPWDREPYDFTYNSFGQLLVATDPTNRPTQNTYDGSNYLWKTTVNSWDGPLVTIYTNSPEGDPILIDGPRTDVTDAVTIIYDALRRKVLEIQPNTGNSHTVATQTHYDPVGRVESLDEGDFAASFTSLRKTTYVYDAVGNKTSEVLSASGSAFSATNYAYDALNRVTCAAVRMNPANFNAGLDGCSLGSEGVDGPDRITHTDYDFLGRPTVIQIGYGTDQVTSFASYAYSPNGQKISVADGRNNKTTYVYDGFDRLRSIIFPAVNVANAGTSNGNDHEDYEYDPSGNRTKLIKRSGAAIIYQYDNMDRMIAKILPSPDTAKSVYNDYDGAGRLLFAHQGSTTGPGVAYAYDLTGRLWQETTFGRTLYSDYDEASNRTRLTWPDGYYEQYVYDAANRLTEARKSGVAYAPYRHVAYTYGPLNQRVLAERGNITTATYGYDPAGRLTTLNLGGATTAPASIQTLAYNPAGQVNYATQATAAYVWTGHPIAPKDTTPDGLNRDSAIATVNGYDPNGNLTNDGTRTFTYDVENRLTSVTGGAQPLALTYDPTGRLFQTTSGTTVTQFLWDGDKLTGEYEGASETIVQRYIHGVASDEPIVALANDDVDAKYMHADRQGSIVATSDKDGVTTPISYGPYGETQGWVGRFRYTGQIALPEAQLYYYKARVYDPVTGRFLQTDPIGQASDPNLYAYVGGDPQNNLDPTGTTVVGIFDNANQLLWLRDQQSGTMSVMQARSGGDLRDIHYAFTPGPAIAPGNYDILDGPHMNDHGMYRLERLGDSMYGDDKADGGGSAYRLHGGTRTAGCVLICNVKDANSVIRMLQSTSKQQANVQDRNGHPKDGTHAVTKYGSISVLGSNASLAVKGGVLQLTTTAAEIGSRIPTKTTIDICKVGDSGGCQ